jgi:hypothetical protein
MSIRGETLGGMRTYGWRSTSTLSSTLPTGAPVSSNCDFRPDCRTWRLLIFTVRASGHSPVRRAARLFSLSCPMMREGVSGSRAKAGFPRLSQSGPNLRVVISGLFTWAGSSARRAANLTMKTSSRRCRPGKPADGGCEREARGDPQVGREASS